MSFSDEQLGLEPVFDRVVLRRDDPYQQSKNAGLVIPEDAGSYMDRLNICTVLGTGPTCVSGIKQGDRVIIGKYAGTDIQIWDLKVVIIREDEILCLVKNLTN